MKSFLHGSRAPPLEAVSKHSAISAKCDLEEPNRMSNSNSRSSSVSLSTSVSNPASSNSSVSLSANSSFASLSLSSMQNINMSNAVHREPVSHPEWTDPHSQNDDNTNNRRRSKRISNKRKRGHVTYYTPKSWESLSPPKKKRKTNVSKPPHSPNHTEGQKRNQPKTKTASQLLSAQNTKMKSIQQKLHKQRLQWLKYHYTAFEPFVSDRVRRKLRTSNDIDIISTQEYMEQPPALCGGVLRDYQLKSVNWLRNLRNNGVPAILADEMGLGKTIQGIATVAAFLHDNNTALCGNNLSSPSLIICPLSVAEAWLTEFNKWMPHLKCVLFHGPKLQRENIMHHKLVFASFDICITTYEIATNNRGFLSKFMWNYFILDEAHRIKNEKTEWHHALKNIWSRCLYAVLLTGTPIQNNMHELWSLLSFMFGDDIFDDDAADIFDSAYQQSTNTQNKALLAKAPYLLNPFFLRRLKSEVELSLPPKEEIIIKINMSKDQKKYYKTFLMAHASLIDQVSVALYGGDKRKAKKQVGAWKKLRHLYTELRKIALHPFLLETYENRVHIDNGREIISHSSKLQLLDKLLHRLKQEGHRVLLFSCFTMVLNLLEVYCQYKGYKYLRLDGQTSRIRRKIDIMRFNDDPNSPFFMYLISNRAGGLGINLQSADTVIHFDTDWNPQADLQAQARAHRIGQKNMVKIYRLISKDTVEERILFRSQQKLYLDAVVNQGAMMLQDSNDVQFDLENEDLLGCIKFGAQKMFENVTDREDDIDLDVLLQRSYNITDDKKEQRQQLLKDLSSENNVRDFNFSMKLEAGNVFEGKTYEKKDYVQDDIDWSKKKRRSKSTMVKELVIDGLRFKTRIEENPMLKFYKQCAEYIYDTRNTKQFHHEMSMCWGCDQRYTPREIAKQDRKIIKCHQCPKTFHASHGCWRGEKTKMGTYICSQHQCLKCGLKTSECGMILRCIGCQSSYCLDCSPSPYWKGNGNDGLLFVDECCVAQHFEYSLPQSTYMYILCSNQCKTFYDSVYCKRGLPDLSAKYEDLPQDLLDRMDRIRKYSIKNKKLVNMCIDRRIVTHDMANNVMQRLRQHFSGDAQLIEKLYDILYLFPISDYDNDEKKEDKDYILPNHFLQMSEINDELSESLSLPQWKRCCKCKKWRVIQIKLDALSNGKWQNDAKYMNWQCSNAASDGLLCDVESVMPSKNNRSSLELSILRLQRELMSVRHRIQSANNDNIKQDKVDLMRIQSEIAKGIHDYKLSSMATFNVNDEHVSEARFIGIGEWNGFINESTKLDESRICAFYEHLIKEMRHWRVESLKTLMDHLGFFVISRKKQRGSKEFHVDHIALSYNKDKIINALAIFLMCPTNALLELTTAYFAK